MTDHLSYFLEYAYDDGQRAQSKTKEFTTMDEFYEFRESMTKQFGDRWTFKLYQRVLVSEQE